MMKLFDLSGRVAVVTGAHGKLGPVWSDALLSAGARVALLDRPGVEPGERTLELQRRYGEERAVCYSVDIREHEPLLQLRERIEKELGAVGVLVNNAGIDQPPSPKPKTFLLEDFPLQDFAEVLSVNLTGAFHCMQVFGSAMKARRSGCIVNVGSLYASVSPDSRFYTHLGSDPPFLKPPPYGASKAGLLNLTKYFATHLGEHGIRVNMLSPGGIAGGQDPEFRRKFIERVPLQRLGEYEDLSGPLLFLASDASGYVTGQELRVDGGFTAW